MLILGKHCIADKLKTCEFLEGVCKGGECLIGAFPELHVAVNRAEQIDLTEQYMSFLLLFDMYMCICCGSILPGWYNLVFVLVYKVVLRVKLYSNIIHVCTLYVCKLCKICQ